MAGFACCHDLMTSIVALKIIVLSVHGSICKQGFFDFRLLRALHFSSLRIVGYLTSKLPFINIIIVLISARVDVFFWSFGVLDKKNIPKFSPFSEESRSAMCQLCKQFGSQ